MTKALLALSVATAAIVASAPAEARHAHQYACTRYRHGHCVAMHRYNVGYVFGPRYSYVGIAALPGPIVTRYRLGHNFRYVQENGFIYVVNPRTYRVVRVIPAY
jgi:hypothetical protein